MNAKTLNGNILITILGIPVKHALYSKDGTWYHNLRQFPGALFDENGFIIFSDSVSYQDSKGLRIRKDLNVVNGINTLEMYQKFTIEQIKRIKDFQNKILLNEEYCWQVFSLRAEAYLNN